MKEQQLPCVALAVIAALLGGCGGGSAQPSDSKTQSRSTTCYPSATPAMVGLCVDGGQTPDATPASAPCRTPAAPAGFKATPPVSPESECAAAT